MPNFAVGAADALAPEFAFGTPLPQRGLRYKLRSATRRVDDKSSDDSSQGGVKDLTVTEAIEASATSGVVAVSPNGSDEVSSNGQADDGEDGTTAVEGQNDDEPMEAPGPAPVVADDGEDGTTAVDGPNDNEHMEAPGPAPVVANAPAAGRWRGTWPEKDEFPVKTAVRPTKRFKRADGSFDYLAYGAACASLHSRNSPRVGDVNKGSTSIVDYNAQQEENRRMQIKFPGTDSTDGWADHPGWMITNRERKNKPGTFNKVYFHQERPMDTFESANGNPQSVGKRSVQQYMIANGDIPRPP